MRYLKRFNEGEQYSNRFPGLSEHDTQVIDDVKDISLELTDGLFTVSHSHRLYDSSISIENIEFEDDYMAIRFNFDVLNTTLLDFKYSDIKATMDRLFEYLKGNLQYVEAMVSTGQYPETERNTISLMRGNPDCENIVNDELKDKTIKSIKLVYTRNNYKMK